VKNEYPNAQGVEFDVVDLDLQPRERAVNMTAVSGLQSLPQLHINGKYFGNFEALQVCEQRFF
jgi:glutaredoxin